MATGITISAQGAVDPEVLTLQEETDAAIELLQAGTGITGLNGASVPAAGALTTGNVLKVSGVSALTYGAVNLAGGSDHVTGVLPWANTTGLNGATVPAAGALTTGNVPQVSGVSAISYGPVNLAGGSDYVSGILPAGNIPYFTDEWTNAVAPDAAGLLVATATQVAPLTVLAADLITAGKDALAAYPRNVTFTTAGGTPSDAPADAVVTGTDIDGNALIETITVAQTATISEGAKCFKTIVSIVYAAADGTDATVSIGFGKKFGLIKSIKVRAGLVNVLKEIADGAVVTNGVVANATTSPPHGSYSPNADPDGAKDYAVTYERT